MIVAIIVFSLIVIIPYSIYFNNRLKESKDQKLFLSENLYRSTIWIVPLVFIPILFINLLFDNPTEEPKTIPEKYDLSEAKKYRKDSANSISFHKKYIESYTSTTHSIALDEEIKNYYFKLTKIDTLKQFGYLGTGFLQLKLGQIDSAILWLDSTEIQLPFRNLLLANSHLQLKNDSLYQEYLILEATNPIGYREDAFNELESILLSDYDISFLDRIRKIRDAGAYIHSQIARKIYYDHFEILKYYHVVWDWYIKDINLIGFIAAILILIVWFIYLIKLSFFSSIKWPYVLTILVLGMISSFLTFLISDVFHFTFDFWEGNDRGFNLLFYSIFGIGAVEELVKILPLLVILLVSRKKLQPFEYLLFASISALGFAFVENLLYFNGEQFGHIIHGRALTAAVGHMIDSSIFAYGLMLAAYRKKHHILYYFTLYWFYSALAHGLYDYFIFAQLLFFFFAFFFLIARVWNTLINNSLNNSENSKYTKNFKTKNIQFFLAFSLTAILMFEYVIVGTLENADMANLRLISAAFSGSFLIMFLGSKLTTIDLIKGHWKKVDFSINPLTDDVVSQNFIGQKIFLRSYYIDDGLVIYFPDGVDGVIVNRVVLRNKPATFFMDHVDPDWFLVKLRKPLKDEQFNNSQVLIKLKEPYSSLNIAKPIMVSLLLIPKKLPRPKTMRKNFTSLGWAFLEGR